MKSTIPDGRRPVGRPGLFGTKTNSAQAEAGARAELGNRKTELNKVTADVDQDGNRCSRFSA